ncbi:DUF1129 family protein [Lactobacillus sp. ESL0791]|uniref:DUF1129 family protein n=1 Tax=Lactobacillus sp. ESL0791 TaxID=2983234 RepID=UPI0023F66AB7|nr:DUF1129 family protein [Lactobacillus sp. ESL0791]MDF7639715.1 DUF1129 family protein [Lactobacillus sp. ESL0791]
MAEEKKEETTSKVDVDEQEKLKNKTAVVNKDEEIKHMTAKELRPMLSNKNSDYVFRLQKELEEQGQMSSEEAAQKVDAHLNEIIIAQHHGQPAGTFYNMSPKLKAAAILKPKEIGPEDIPTWQYVVDSALLYVAIFVGIFGVIGLFQTGKQAYNSQMGILSLVSVGAIIGWFTVKYNDWILPATSDKSKKIPWGRVIVSMLALVVVLFAWLGLLSIPAVQVINPILPGIDNIIVAAAAYGIRWLFRRHYHIRWSTFTRTTSSK